MHQLFSCNDSFDTDQGSGTVTKRLGAGGQGEVYLAKYAGQDVALKWYYPHLAHPEQRAGIEALVQKGSPDSRFLWPEALATSEKAGGFGYVMRLRDRSHVEIPDLLADRVQPTFRALVKACYHAADAYHHLHSAGLCYRDISFGNLFFDPKTGGVLICDNDNVSVGGAGWDGVAGTDGFMAPELMLGKVRPSAETDLYSLGVLLFYLLFVHHPLKGALEQRIRCWDLAAKRQIFGSQPVYIFDPNDESNRPVPGVQQNAIEYWKVYPLALKRLFEQHFTVGLHRPGRRVREPQWKQAFADLYDAVFPCPSCRAENFYDREAMSGGGLGQCWACGDALGSPPRLRLGGKRVVALSPDTVLHPHHLTESPSDYDFERSTATVSPKPSQPSVWGLSNESDERWVCTLSDGRRMDIEPGQTVGLSEGLRIQLGQVEAEVRV